MHNFDNSHDVTVLKKRLKDHLPRLIDCLFSGRTIHRIAHEYRVGTHGSISIRLVDGAYFDHESCKGGDVFTLIQHVLKTDFKGALVYARGFLGHAPLPTVPTFTPKHTNPDARAFHQRDKVLAMLKRAKPIKGTIADAYLRKKRCITKDPLPVALGFIASVYNYTADRYYPVMIATICDKHGNPIAAHCTFLDPATCDKIHGDGIKPRLIYGACRGGAIRLSPFRNPVMVCEGIEDGLSILQKIPNACVWVSAGTSGMASMEWPDDATEVVIASDYDPKGAGQAAALKLAIRLKKEGRVARIATPAPFKDFNELLVQENLACLTA